MMRRTARQADTRVSIALSLLAAVLALLGAHQMALQGFGKAGGPPVQMAFTPVPSPAR